MGAIDRREVETKLVQQTAYEEGGGADIKPGTQIYDQYQYLFNLSLEVCFGTQRHTHNPGLHTHRITLTPFSSFSLSHRYVR